MDPIQSIKDRLSIEDLVSSYVTLKRAGRYLKACCPFHQEKTPSFFVSPEKQIAYCFSCQKGGDIFEFMQAIEGVSFREALELLAERAHVDLPKQSAGPKLPKDEKDRLWSCLESSNQFFVQQFWTTDDGKKVLGYMQRRAFSDEMLKAFDIGFAPESHDALFRALLNKGFSKADILASTMAIARDAASEQIRDRFHLRLMIPIHDFSGRPVAFGGRALKQGDEPKYLNSPEYELYKKSHVLYNLHRAKAAIRADGFTIVVEGYMDVMASTQMGIANVVAPCGTATTPEQFRLLKRYAPKVALAFDADSAGQEALLRAIKGALEQDLQVEVIMMKEVKDAGEALQKNPEFWKTAVAARRHWFDAAVDVARGRFALETAPGKRDFTDFMADLLGAVKHPVEKEALLAQLAQVLEVPVEFVRESVTRSQPKKRLVKTEVEESIKHSASYPLLKRFLSLLIAYPQECMTLWTRYEKAEDFEKDLKDRGVVFPFHKFTHPLFAEFHLRFAEVLDELDTEQAFTSVYKEILSHYNPSAHWDETLILQELGLDSLKGAVLQTQVQVQEEGLDVLAEFQGLIAQLYLHSLPLLKHGSN